MKQEIKLLIKAIESQQIGPDEALLYMAEIEFNDRLTDMLKWGAYYFPDKFSLPFCEVLHRYLVDVSKMERTATLAPRGHAKTTIMCFLVPIYMALNEPEAYRHYLNIQATATRAIDVNISLKREFEQNERLTKDYGYMVTDEKWTEKQFVLKNGVVFTAIGSGEAIRGKAYRNQRPDFVIADDLYDDDCLYSPARVKKINDWFKSAIMPAIAPDRTTAIHILGTAISKADLMHEFGAIESWVSNRFQAVNNDHKTTLWVENKLRGYDYFINLKNDMGSIIFEREYQNNVRDDDTSIIKQSWIRFFSGQIPNDEEIVKKIGGVDPAISDGKNADYTAKVAVYVSKTGAHYVMDARNDRMTFNANIEDAKAFYSLHKFNEYRWEAIGAFQAYSQELKRLTALPIKEIKSVKNKHQRLESVSHLFENSKVWISEKIQKEIKTELVDQLINNNPDHDDLRDALVSCLERRESYLKIL